MKTRTDFFKDATIERVRNRIIMVHMDLCKMVQKRNELNKMVAEYKKRVADLETEINYLTAEIVERRAEIDHCEAFLLGAKKAGATNADSPIHYVNAETDETEDNSSKDDDEDDAECIEEE